MTGGGAEAILARYLVLADALAKSSTTPGPPHIKRFATVLAVVQFLEPDLPPASVALLLDLLPPAEAKLHRDTLRGAIAAGVAILRCTNMKISRIKQWLDEEIRRRALGFTAHDAVRWFYECSNANPSISRTTLTMFRTYSPEPSLSLTETIAKKRVTPILNAARVMEVGPLTRQRRRS